MFCILGEIKDQPTSLRALHRSIAHCSFVVQYLMVNAAVKPPCVSIRHEDGTICNPIPAQVNKRGGNGQVTEIKKLTVLLLQSLVDPSRWLTGVPGDHEPPLRS